MQVGDDGGGLKIVDRFVRRHRRPGDAFFDDGDQFALCACGGGRAAKLASAEIGLGERVAVGAVAREAIGAIEASAVFDVGGCIAVLREERARYQKQYQ